MHEARMAALLLLAKRQNIDSSTEYLICVSVYASNVLKNTLYECAQTTFSQKPSCVIKSSPHLIYMYNKTVRAACLQTKQLNHTIINI